MNELFMTSVCHLPVPRPCILILPKLELQGHTQVSPWFPTSPDYTFLLSGNPSGSSATGLHLPTILFTPMFGSSRPAHYGAT